MRTAPKRARTSEPTRPIGSPFPPISGSVAAVICWGARPTPSSDHDPTATGRAVPVHPTPANSLAGPAEARCRRLARAASMVVCPAPESRTKGKGPWAPMQTSTVSATCPATVLTVSGTRVVPPPSAVAPVHPVAGGGNLKVTSGSTCTEGGEPGLLMAAARTSASTATAMAAIAATRSPRRPRIG